MLHVSPSETLPEPRPASYSYQRSTAIFLPHYSMRRRCFKYKAGSFSCMMRKQFLNTSRKFTFAVAVYPSKTGSWKQSSKSPLCLIILAEREGFEPSREFPAHNYGACGAFQEVNKHFFIHRPALSIFQCIDHNFQRREQPWNIFFHNFPDHVIANALIVVSNNLT